MNKIAEDLYYKEYNKLVKKYNKQAKSNLFLNKICKKLFGKKYIGTFPSDRIPRLKNNNYTIINLDDSSLPGSHWVAIAKKTNKTYIYDSFGRKTQKILPSIYGSGNKNIYMTDPDINQKNDSSCALHCISWLIICDKYGFEYSKHI